MAQHPSTAAIVLAAGDGKRLKSELPKVLHRVAGRSLLGHVLAAVEPLELAQIVIVCSNRVDEIASVVSSEDLDATLDLVIQSSPRGTGDAVRIAMPALHDQIQQIVVLAGDTPLIRTATIDSMLARQEETSSAATMLTARVDDPSGYGR